VNHVDVWPESDCEPLFEGVSVTIPACAVAQSIDTDARESWSMRERFMTSCPLFGLNVRRREERTTWLGVNKCVIDAPALPNASQTGASGTAEAVGFETKVIITQQTSPAVATSHLTTSVTLDCSPRVSSK
jgi:hypothetical protein